ncbi:type II toxin-antitoxin system VapC family toxin [Longimicrobium sp.]|uniref:type II toxin-antitoxin system VapC family toxin n=1 Tax=Longimicrobium sp. TaxID=2029185 RepID=UPI003B3AEBEF
MSTRALLDTHSFLWFIGGSERLSPRARTLIEARENPILVSVAGLWEIAIKNGIGKLALDRPFAELIPEQLERQQIGVLGIELRHLDALTRLPQHHRDPFDRLIAAQALTEEVPVISVDPALDAYGVQRLW